MRHPLPELHSSRHSMWRQVTCASSLRRWSTISVSASTATAWITCPSISHPGPDWATSWGFPIPMSLRASKTCLSFSPSTYLGVGQTRSLPLYRRENTFQELDNLTWTKGAHTFKIGADFRRRQLTIYQTNEGNGRFNFSPAFTDSRNPAGKGGDAAASFLLGFPTLDAHDYNYQFPGIRLNEVRYLLCRRLAGHQEPDHQLWSALGLLQPAR